jgi:glycosylphosphatidylinositol transamidase (GPIT) subunit GPI8/ABC-type branched-subunit amino acid transport system substrate-binding protein
MSHASHASAQKIASVAALLLGAATGCSAPATPDEDPIRIAVLAPEDSSPGMAWALENVNASGGIAGRPLALEALDPTDEALEELGERLSADDRYTAVIGPSDSRSLQEIAPFFLWNRKPIVSPTSTSDDLLRLFGDDGAVWRIRESDLAQTELLVRFAEDSAAERITLLASADVTGSTFSSWFGFFARQHGYPEDRVSVVELDAADPCDAKVKEALGTQPDMLFVAAGGAEQVACVVKNVALVGATRPRIVLADTGFDASIVASMPEAQGIEGVSAAGDASFEVAFHARFGSVGVASHAANGYDAVLLLAYGLELSGGEGGRALIKAMKEAVDGRSPSSRGWDQDGIARTFSALRSGERPLLRGATGPLAFEPALRMDLATSTLAHWLVGPEGLVVDDRLSTGDPSLLVSHGAFVAEGPTSVDGTLIPKKTDSWAVIAALSSGWSNYRHQADALQQYEMLRAGGMDDDHIVLIMADDLADDPNNELPGTVRNEPGGEDLHAGVEVDYGVSITVDQIRNVLTGQVTADTPEVIHAGAGSDVYIYLVGHGGPSGIALNASTLDEGLRPEKPILSPALLRESLCTLQEQQRLRRALVVVESCYAGVFGEAAHGGLELGCGSDGEEPLREVVLMTSSNGEELSYAGEYDEEVDEWVNDAFSRRFADKARSSPSASLADLYVDAYRGTFGSHPSVYNLDHAGRLTAVRLAEFFTP